MEMCQNLRIHLNTSAETSKSRLDALALFLGLYRWLPLFKRCPRSTSYYPKIILYSRTYGHEIRRGWVNIVTYFSHQKMSEGRGCVQGNNLECQTVCDIPSRKLFRVWVVGWVDVFFLLFLIAPSDLEILSCRSISHDVKFHSKCPFTRFSAGCFMYRKTVKV